MGESRVGVLGQGGGILSRMCRAWVLHYPQMVLHAQAWPRGFWLCYVFLRKFTAPCLHVPACHGCTVHFTLAIHSHPLPCSGPWEAVCMHRISTLPFPLAWPTRGASLETGGQEESEPKALTASAPALLGPGSSASLSKGLCSRLMFISYSY